MVFVRTPFMTIVAWRLMFWTFRYVFLLWIGAIEVHVWITLSRTKSYGSWCIFQWLCRFNIVRQGVWHVVNEYGYVRRMKKRHRRSRTLSKVTWKPYWTWSTSQPSSQLIHFHIPQHACLHNDYGHRLCTRAFALHCSLASCSTMTIRYMKHREFAVINASLRE